MEGSPPLTRGIRAWPVAAAGLARFTPAHAGNTPADLFRMFHCQVHPRSRGEYDEFAKFKGATPGSPPLTRGIPRSFTISIASFRFTPAHAGNTVSTTPESTEN